MKLLMFSGNSLANRTWIYEARDRLSDLVESIYVQDYHHWTSGADWIDLEFELGVTAEHDFGESYGIFAKSMGTVLATQALWHKYLEPKFLLFMGVPLGYLEPNNPQFREVLADFKTPLTVIQNDRDPVGGAREVEAYLAEKLADRGDYSFIASTGDTHNYGDFELLRTELKRLVELA